MQFWQFGLAKYTFEMISSICQWLRISTEYYEERLWASLVKFVIVVMGKWYVMLKPKIKWEGFKFELYTKNVNEKYRWFRRFEIEKKFSRRGSPCDSCDYLEKSSEKWQLLKMRARLFKNPIK